MSEDRVNLANMQQPVSPQDFQAPAVPAEVIPLPSEGKVYPQGHPLKDKTSIAIKAMTAKEEDILTSRALIRSGKLVGALLRSCIIDKTVDPDQMLTGDRNAILIGIRITGYGAGYPVKFECPSCSLEEKQEIDLSQLPLKRFPQNLNPTENAFTITLPVSKKSCTFKLLNGAEEQELLQILERGKKVAGVEELVTNRLKRQIVELGGERDPHRLALAINNMPARDSRELRKFIDTVTPGVELKTQFTCSTCGHQGEVEVPLGTEFFWPES